MEVIVGRPPLAFPIAEASQVGEARRQTLALAEAVGLDEGLSGKLALVITELGTNLVKHAAGGELLVRALPAPGVEVVAVDRGAGMADVGDCFRDGYSTAGSLGTGLGAVRRLSSYVDCYSTRPGGPAPGGTVIVARVCAGGPRGARELSLGIGVVSVPMRGEEVCGDGWAAAREGDAPALMMVDGLGHGVLARDAALAAERAFEATPSLSPAAQVEAIHDALRGTRGAAVAVARIDRAQGVVAYAGLGNIAGVLVAAGASRHLVSGNGTAGHDAARIHEFTYPWSDDALLVMSSDGLGTRWQLERYPGLEMRDPSLVAGVLYRDWSRGRDDVTVLAARMRRS
ncbi:MAG: SpoIIE family protein phosphatase [Candidatus Rokuibacteriota bacterium]